MLTMWPDPCLEHLRRDPLRDVEEAGEIGRDLGVEVLGRVVGEGLGDEDAGIVDQRVDPPEPRDRLPNHRFGGRRIADIAAHRHDILIAGLLDRAGGRHDPVVAIPERLDQAGADAL